MLLQIQAAIDAVDSTDVLNQEINYEAAGERVRQRQRLAQQAQAQQQAIGNGSGPAVVPSAGLLRSAATQAPPATPAAPAADAPPQAAPFGQSGVSISKNLGKPPSGALSQEVSGATSCMPIRVGLLQCAASRWRRETGRLNHTPEKWFHVLINDVICAPDVAIASVCLRLVISQRRPLGP